MAEPTNIIQAADITAQASIAATEMADMLTNMQTRLDPFGSDDVFYVAPINAALDPQINGQYFEGAPFEAVTAALNNISSSYSQANLGTTPVPNAPNLAFTQQIDATPAPALTAAAAPVVLPNAPSVTIPSAPTAPNIEDIDVPLAPVVAIPSIPELAEVTLPSISSISIPLFTETFPEVPADLLPPDTAFMYEEEEYTSDELVALRDLILDDLQNGGWGVNHTDEEALFDREVDRATSAGVANEETTIETMAARGFDLPTGPLVALLRKNQQATLNEVSSANREVSIQRADLIRKSRENVIANSLQLNQTMVTHFGFVQQRLLSAAQSTIDFALRTFNAQAELYNLRVQAYQAYATTWNIQIQGQIAQLEAEKAQLQAEAMKIDVSRAQIDAYTAQVRAVALQIDIYNTEMQAAQVRADIERNKLLVFNSQVDAHRAAIQAEISKISAYTAQVDAEGTKVNLYRAQVDAHGSEVAAAKMASDIQVQRASIELDQQRTKLISYEAAIKGYSAELAANTAAAELHVSVVDGQGRIAAAQGDVAAGYANVFSSSTDSFNRVNALVSQMRVSEQRNISDHNIEMMKARIDNFTKPAEMWQNFYESLGVLASAVDVEIK